MTVQTYKEHHDNVHGRRRVLFDVARWQVWLSVLGLLGGMVVSAAAGVLATAHAVVPPIAAEALRPELDRLAITDARIEASINKVERDGQNRDSENMQALRQQMADLQTQLHQATEAMTALLLKLAKGPR